MNFDEIVWGTAAASKQLESKWFFDANINNDTNGFKTEIHRMPFQRRNLSYCKGVQYRKWRKSHKKPVASTKPKKPKDLLFDLWKHRVRNYNDAFLSSPRRATRNYAKKTPAKEEKKVIVSNETEPKKLDMLEAKQNGAVTVAEAPKGAHGAPAVAKDKQVAEKKIQTAATDDAVMTESDDLSGKRSCPDSVANLMSEHDGSSLDSLGKQKRRAQQQTISELDEDSYNAVVTWSSKQGDNQGGLIDPQTKVLFHFTYFEEQPNGGAAQLCFQTDATPDNFVGHRRCIFCYFNGGTDTGLLMHCVTSHSDYLDFNAARSEDGTLHIAVSKKATTTEKRPREFVYVRRPTTGARTVPSVPFVKRLPSELATLDVHTRRKNIRLLSETGADESAVKQFLPNSEVAIRQYYHSRSNEPMLEGEWDVDSDDEEDEDWLTKMSEELLDEFEDVTAPEKRFTKLWNRFMKCHTVVADQVIPSKCAEFVSEYSQALVEMDLRQELLLHFTGLWDAGLISAAHLKNLMADFDKGLVAYAMMKPR